MSETKRSLYDNLVTYLTNYLSKHPRRICLLQIKYIFNTSALTCHCSIGTGTDQATYPCRSYTEFKNSILYLMKDKEVLNPWLITSCPKLISRDKVIYLTSKTLYNPMFDQNSYHTEELSTKKDSTFILDCHKRNI